MGRTGRLNKWKSRDRLRVKNPTLRLRSGQALSHTPREGWGTLEILLVTAVSKQYRGIEKAHARADL